MRLAVSNLGWSREEDAEVLAALDVDALEVAPTKLWDDPLAVPQAELDAYRELAGRPIVALQALLFGRPELRIFGSSPDATLAYLRGMCDLAAALGAGVLVFGSPGNRSRAGLDPGEAFALATAFFRELGDHAAVRGVCVCIEPLPEQLGCDFVQSSAEGRELVRAVGSDGFGLHLDSSALHLAGEDPFEAIGPDVRHFHASEIGFGVLGETGIDHASCAWALREAGYQGTVSVEMLATDGPNLERVRTSVERARGFYG